MKTFNVEILANDKVAEKIFCFTVDAPELAETARSGQVWAASCGTRSMVERSEFGNMAYKIGAAL